VRTDSHAREGEGAVSDCSRDAAQAQCEAAMIPPQAAFPDAPVKVAVLGATGAIGKALVAQLVSRPNVAVVTVFVRKLQNPFPGLSEEQLKRNVLQQKQVDYDHIQNYANELDGHSNVFCCLGTVRSKVASDEEFIKVDKTYVLEAAKIARAKGVPHFSLVSSIGADATSWFLYPRTKGQTEEELKKLSFPHLSIFRPAVLIADRAETRWGEALAKWPSYLTAHTRPIEVVQVAKAMIADAFRPEEQKKPAEIFENEVAHKM